MTTADWNTDPPTHRGWVTLDDRTVGSTCSGSAIDHGMNARGRPLGELPADARKAFRSDKPGEVEPSAGTAEPAPAVVPSC